MVQIIVGVIIFIAALLVISALSTLALFAGFSIVWTILKIIVIAAFLIWIIRIIAGFLPPKV